MKVGAFSAVAAFALAAGGIAAALLIPDATTGNNVISAGHLVVEINHGLGSQLSIDNMAPGEHRFAYQLITGDMAGIGTADLSLTLFGGDPTSLFAQNATLDVAFSPPLTQAAAGWTGSECGPSVSYGTPISLGHIATIPVLQTSATPSLLGELTGPHAPNPDLTAVCVRFDIGLDQAAGNDVQAATGAFSMAYSLVQTSADTP